MTFERVILLSKRDAWCQHAARIVEIAFPGSTWHAGGRFDPFPLVAETSCDLLISFLSPWIVPAPILSRAGVAINFHPASSRYPGIGCYNFALYENSHEYGAVAHHMAPKVDSGALVAERLFPVFPADTVETLKLRTMVVMLAMFQEIVGDLASGKPLPSCTSTWQRRPFTRKELNALTVLTPEMEPEEIARRVRATTYPGFPGATLEVGGVCFAAPVPDREPFA